MKTLNNYINEALIKKDTKNQIQIKPEFYELYNNDTKNIIELNEDENKKISNKKRVKKTKSNISQIYSDFKFNFLCKYT